MKKFFILILLTFAMNVNAQTYDETQLIGTWEPTEINGTLPGGIKSFASIILEDLFHMKGDYIDGPISGRITDLVYTFEDDYKYSPSIPDFFISNGNKLHIQVSNDYSLRFIIEELTDAVLKVKTYDGTCLITLAKKASTQVRATQTIASENAAMYNMSGQKIETPQPNTVYIQGGQKKLMQR